MRIWIGMANTRRVFDTATIALVSTLLSCSTERPLGQVPEKYNLYAVVEVPGGMAIDVIDAETDSVMRRLPSAGTAASTDIVVSPSGDFLATLSNYGVITLFDLKTEAIIGSARGASRGSFVSTASQFFGANQQSVSVFNLPDLSVDTLLDMSFLSCLQSRRPNEAAAVVAPPVQSYSSFIRFSTSDWSVIDSFTFRTGASGEGVVVLGETLSPDERSVCVIGADESGIAVYRFDLTTHEALFRTPLQTSLGWVQVTPDGGEVWVTQTYSPFDRPPPVDLGYVLIVDGKVGTAIDTIRTIGLSGYVPQWPLILGQIAFHPTRSRAYIAVYGDVPGVLVIDTETRRIVSVLYGDELASVTAIALAPRK